MNTHRFRILASVTTLATCFLALTGEPQLASAVTKVSATEYTRVSTGAVEVASSDRVDVAIANVGEASMRVVIEFYDENGRQREALEQSLRPGQSAISGIRVDAIPGTPPKLIRTVIDAETPCPPSGPGGFIARGTHQSAQLGTVDSFAACPVVVCSGLPGTGRHSFAPMSGCVVDSSREN